MSCPTFADLNQRHVQKGHNVKATSPPPPPRPQLRARTSGTVLCMSCCGRYQANSRISLDLASIILLTQHISAHLGCSCDPHAVRVGAPQGTKISPKRLYKMHRSRLQSRTGLVVRFPAGKNGQRRDTYWQRCNSR